MRSAHAEQDPRIFHRAELCRWLLKTDIRMSACFSMDMHDKDTFTESGNSPLLGLGAAPSSSGGAGGAISSGEGGDELPNRPPHVVYDRRMCRFGYKVLENSEEPPPPGEMSRKFAAEVMPECQLLMKAMQR